MCVVVFNCIASYLWVGDLSTSVYLRGDPRREMRREGSIRELSSKLLLCLGNWPLMLQINSGKWQETCILVFQPQELGAAVLAHQSPSAFWLVCPRVLPAFSVLIQSQLPRLQRKSKVKRQHFRPQVVSPGGNGPVPPVSVRVTLRKKKSLWLWLTPKEKLEYKYGPLCNAWG